MHTWVRIASIPASVLRRNRPYPTVKNMLKRVWWHDYLVNAPDQSGIKYVIGETNSISRQGAINISDVMASAVWAVDYRCRSHASTSIWAPGTAIHRGNQSCVTTQKPTSIPCLLNESAFASSNKHTEVLTNQTNIGACALYDSGSLESIVGVNLDICNSTLILTQDPTRH